jgi:amino-acid N-acetyltransferase
MNIRKANLNDVEAIHNLANQYAQLGLMLPRSRSSLYESIRDFAVVEIDDVIVGMGALHIMWKDLAEIRTLAILPEFQTQGIGKALADYLLTEAKNLALAKVFTLTYKPDFFTKVGFVEISKDQMPHKVWRDCINCPKFPNCDEVCMVVEI